MYHNYITIWYLSAHNYTKNLFNYKSFGCYFYIIISLVFHYFRFKSFVYNNKNTQCFNSDDILKSAAITNVFVITVMFLSINTGLHHSTGCGISVTGHITGGEHHLHYCCVCPTENVKETSC